MPADLLVMKKRGDKVEVKITTRMRKGYAPPNYTIVVNFKNYKDLALFLHDLEDLQDAPVKKAVEEYLRGTQKTWPF
jgi:hypothetical protein